MNSNRQGPLLRRWLRRTGRGLATGGLSVIMSAFAGEPVEPSELPEERQITRSEQGHILTNTGVWSPDSRWIVYDTRSDPAGEVFDGDRIEAVRVETGEVRELYRSTRGAKCGVVTFHPVDQSVFFIHGPEDPTPDWSYGPYHREGAWVAWEPPGRRRNLDARDLVPPFTPGALRGGSHVHVSSPDGAWVSFTYEDHVLATRSATDPAAEPNQRNIGVTVLGRPVKVGGGHPRNRDGEGFTVLVTRTRPEARPGSDDLLKAFEEAWVGERGYRRADGTWQRRALAFQGHVRLENGSVVSEVFVADLPEDLTRRGEGPLEGTERTRPSPPAGVVQRRLTHTGDRRHPGLQGPRHWLRSSADGEHIAFLMKDDAGVAQLHVITPRGTGIRPVTALPGGVGSAFSWTPDGRRLAFHSGGRVCLAEVDTGKVTALTRARANPEEAPRPEACVVSPDGRRVAYVRRVPAGSGRSFNQVFVVTIPRPGA